LLPLQVSQAVGEVCPICDSRELSIAFSVRSVNCREIQAFVVRCGCCGVGQSIYESPELAQAFAYPSDYYSYSSVRYSSLKQKLKRTLFTVVPQVLLQSVAHRWLSIIPASNPGKVLDVGCGCGVFLDLLKKLGWKTCGTDISAKALAICESNGHQVCAPGEMLQRFGQESFDWITLDNVLEHIAEPYAVLIQLHQLLRTDGRLTICVPNFGGRDAALFDGFWEMLDPPHHYFHYTASGISMVLRRCGFVVKQITFQARFGAYYSLKSAREYGDNTRYRRLKSNLAVLQARKALRLVLPARISEEYGYFLTVEAAKI